ncbi:hypothetical protein [uncultured Enterovirga sp.]|uniref:head-tail connector protein n=1 Tax=uncultured Enterovirga sp. TaxID=2026352 RepID=UPI0035CBBB18
MSPIALVGPAVEPVTLDAMKRYLRLDGTEEDDLVSALIMAGRLTVERTARLSLLEQSWRVRLRSWPPGRVVALPVFPVLAVEAVRLVRPASMPDLLSPDMYRLDLDCDPVRLLIDATAPDPAGPHGAIEIDVACGYGSAPAAVPEPLRLAIQRLVAHWFEHRGDDGPPPGGKLPADALALVAPYLRPRLA